MSAVPEPPSRSEHARIEKVFVQPLASLHEIVARVTDAMYRGPDVVSVVGLPKRVYCFRHPDAISQIFLDRGTGGQKYLPRIAWLHWFYRSGGFARAPDEVWRNRRRAAQPAFSVDALGVLLPAFQSAIQERIDKWQADLARSGKQEITVDFFRACWELIVDASLRGFFSTNIGARLSEITDMSQFIERNLVEPIPLWLPFAKNRKFKREGGSLRAFFRTLIEERRTKNTDQYRDVLALLLAEADNRGVFANDEEIVDELGSLYFGMCVMSVSLTWAIYLLATHPDAQKRVQFEAAQFLETGIEVRNRRSLGYPYTNQVFHEAARLRPPIWGLPRLAKEATRIMGQDVPGGTVVVPMIWLAHRDERFWPIPEVFDPDRFNADGTTPEKAPAYFPYGLGMRKCSGMNVAPLLMQLVPLMLLSYFEISFTPRFEGDPITEFGFEVIPKGGMPLKLRLKSS